MIAVQQPPIPAVYLPTGDRTLILAWRDGDDGRAGAVFVLEDGRVTAQPLETLSIDYRWDINRQKWVDVSGIPLDIELEDDGADTDQGDEDDGRPSVSGLVPDADGTS